MNEPGRSDTPEQPAGTPAWWRLRLPFSERRALLVVGDTLLLTLSGWSAAHAWLWMNRSAGGSASLGESHLFWLVFLAGLWLMFASVNECYNLRRSADPRQITRSLVLTAAAVLAIYLVIYFLLGEPVGVGHREDRTLEDILWIVHLIAWYRPPRLIPTVFVMVSLVLLTAWRVGYASLLTSTPFRRRILVVGVGRPAKAVADAVASGLHHCEIVGFVDDGALDAVSENFDAPVVPNDAILEDAIGELSVDEIVIAARDIRQPDLVRVVLRCREHGVEVRPMADVYEEALGRFPVQFVGEDITQIPIFRRRDGIPFWALFKRIIDLFGALVILAVTLVLFPFVAAAVLIESGRPLFYVQDRVGKEGRIFPLVKFRTMGKDAEPDGEAVWAADRDPRVTRVGRFLRSTRIDELPQCVNVLRGEMSLVGPRPERPEFVRELEQQVPLYRTRLWVKPGLTGWAQIRYRYGNTLKDSLIKLQFDVYYVKHKSFRLDLLILLRTVKVVLAMGGT